MDSPQIVKYIEHFEKSQTVYSQGESCSSVLYIKSGTVKVSAMDEDGKEGVIAILEAGDFLGEACLSDGFPERVGRAAAMESTAVFVIHKKEMLRVLREEQDFRTISFPICSGGMPGLKRT